uniref:Uncharacterized protein n=1 Tax=Ditylum brightwellii TaxID=49249 RepID=A0A6U3SB12_9STRA|mmetsp:Transcript_32788/g.48822  ORF Transcript_32788/g.48822 Transcript_32788/m.48822 type:complete len:157 (+) Transcript_32788:2686-3156(+)
MELERYMGLLISPKSHIIEDHLCGQQMLFDGIGDLEESFGEQNHQYETIADWRHGGTRDFAIQEKIKAKEQAQFNHPDVREKVESIKNKRKRKGDDASRKERRFEQAARGKRQKQDQARLEVLAIIIQTGSKLTSIQSEQKRLFGTSRTLVCDDND